MTVQWAASLSRLVRLRPNGSVRFYGLTVGLFGIGVVHYRPTVPDKSKQR